LAALVLGAPTAGAASGCLDQVRNLASEHRLSSAPPSATSSKGEITTQELARSGGVIKPPPVQDKAVITPAPEDKRDPMPTVPDIAPKAQQEAPAADRTRLQAALTAARERAEQGDEKGCQEALARAHTLADRTN
jgi:hypothetical protein